MVENNVNEPKPKKYCLTYYGPDNQVAGSLEFEMSELPSHDQIMAILEQFLPGRPNGGWYMMETIAEENDE